MGLGGLWWVLGLLSNIVDYMCGWIHLLSWIYMESLSIDKFAELHLLIKEVCGWLVIEVWSMKFLLHFLFCVFIVFIVCILEYMEVPVCVIVVFSCYSVVTLEVLFFLTCLPSMNGDAWCGISMSSDLCITHVVSFLCLIESTKIKHCFWLTLVIVKLRYS